MDPSTVSVCLLTAEVSGISLPQQLEMMRSVHSFSVACLSDHLCINVDLFSSSVTIAMTSLTASRVARCSRGHITSISSPLSIAAYRRQLQEYQPAARWYTTISPSVCTTSTTAQPIVVMAPVSVPRTAPPVDAVPPLASSPPSSSVHADGSLWVSRDALMDEMLRVDHAGEFAAQWIYEGQLSALRETRTEDKVIKVVEEMRDQELEHLQALNDLIPQHRVRPSALLPVSQVACYALGYVSGLMGTRAAMACTVAVESVITQHYNDQLRELNDSTTVSLKPHQLEIKALIKKHRDDEDAHREIGLEHEAEQLPLYNLFTSIIKAGTHTAIKLASKI